MQSYSMLDHNWLAHKINNDAIIARINQIKGVVYDLGCGTRPYEPDIVANAQSYIGVDWSNTIHTLDADIVADLNLPLPVESNIADSVVSFQVLEHLSEPQVMLNEAFRILKPSGKIFLSVPFQWHEHEVPHDYYRYTRYGLDHIFKKAGFVNVTIEPLTGFWATILLKLNYQLIRFARYGPKPLQLLVRLIITPFLWFNQSIAVYLDRLWPNSTTETAWFFVTGSKS